MAAPQPVLVLPETRPAEVLAARYSHIRRVSLEICAPLQTEDFVVQSMPDASPTKWHLAHTSWFFEQFLLKPLLPGYRAFHPDFEYLFNSYYQSVGRMHERPQRGLLTRPTVEEVRQYREHVDEHMQKLFRARPEDERLLDRLATLGAQSRAAAPGADAHGHQASVLAQSAAARVPGRLRRVERCGCADAFHPVRRRHPRDRRERQALRFRQRAAASSHAGRAVRARRSARHQRRVSRVHPRRRLQAAGVLALGRLEHGRARRLDPPDLLERRRSIASSRCTACSRCDSAAPVSPHQLLRGGRVRALGRWAIADAKRSGSWRPSRCR